MVTVNTLRKIKKKSKKRNKLCDKMTTKCGKRNNEASGDEHQVRELLMRIHKSVEQGFKR